MQVNIANKFNFFHFKVYLACGPILLERKLPGTASLTNTVGPAQTYLWTATTNSLMRISKVIHKTDNLNVQCLHVQD